jgi:hypothetical protein
LKSKGSEKQQQTMDIAATERRVREIKMLRVGIVCGDARKIRFLFLLTLYELRK